MILINPIPSVFTKVIENLGNMIRRNFLEVQAENLEELICFAFKY
jgi:hypothetical protein